MSESTRSCVVRTTTQSEQLVTLENMLNTQINAETQQTLLRMARGTQKQRIDALGVMAAVKSGQLNEIQGADENSINRTFRDFRRNFDKGAFMMAAGPLNPWMCAIVCAACAAAILDPVPGDELVACTLCINLCSASA